MVKTTVYLPEALKRALERAAETEGLSEAELIRTAVETLLSGRAARRPKLPLYSSGRLLAERVDEELAGFGE